MQSVMVRRETRQTTDRVDGGFAFPGAVALDEDDLCHIAPLVSVCAVRELAADSITPASVAPHHSARHCMRLPGGFVSLAWVLGNRTVRFPQVYGQPAEEERVERSKPDRPQRLRRMLRSVRLWRLLTAMVVQRFK